MTDLIKQALEGLNPENPTLWNSDGLPKVDTIRGILGDNKITRADIEAAIPNFTRSEAAKLVLASRQGQADAPDPAPPSQESPPPSQNGAESSQGPILEDFLEVEVKDPEILGMAYQRVVSDLGFVNRGIAEFTHQVTELSRRKGKIEIRLRELSARCANLSAVGQRLESQNKIDPARPIQAYIKKQNEIRAAKAMKAKAFLEAGTNLKDVQAALSNKSKLDAAMNMRKPGLGGRRPSFQVHK
jgi:hypothetical protein